MTNVGLFLLNSLLAVLWMLMWGAFDIYALLAGFVAGYLLLGLLSRVALSTTYGTKLWKLLAFAAYFLRILVQANLQVAREIVTPGFSMTPRLIRYSVEGMTPVQITTLANAITLTPGTLSVDVTEDGRFLYVHSMYARSRAEAVHDLDLLRKRLMEEVFS